ncbi:hypothetical protein ACFL3V_00090 [Nanoarchaeota archaeon]
MLIALALVLSVVAVGNINIQEASILISGNPGATNTSMAATIQNTGAQQLDNIIMNATDLTGASGTMPKSSVSFFSSSFSLIASEIYPNAIILSIPSGQKAGVYTGTINAVHNDSHKDSAALQVTVNAVPDFSAASNTPSIVKGNSGQITVDVANTGNADITGLTYTIASPFTSGSNTIAPTSGTTGSVNINHAASNSFNIAFSPGTTQAAGTYSGQVSLTHMGTTKSITASVIVKDPEYKVDLPAVIHSESERGVSVSKSVTIKNSGDYTLTAVTVTSSDGDTTVTGTIPSTLTPGQEFQVTVSTEVPDNADSGLFKVGTLNFNSAEFSKTSDIKVNAESGLEFDTVKISIADNSYDSVNEDSTADDEATPGDEFTLKIQMKNTLDDDDNDNDMEDVTITAIFYGAGEDGDDIDEDSDNFDIDAGDDSEWVDIFEDEMIDWDSDDGKLIMELTAEGEDDNGATHTASFNFSIDVERESKAEIVFSRLDATSSVSCGNTLTIYADGKNTGKKGEDETVLKLLGDDFNLQQRVEFEMGAYDEDDGCNAIDPDEDECMEFDYKTSIKVPATLGAGTYTIVGKLYRDDGNKQTDERRVDVKVTCSPSSSSSSSSSSSGTTSGSSTSSGSSSGTTSGSSTSDDSKSSEASEADDAASSTTSSVQILYSGGQTAPTTQGVVAGTPTKITDMTEKSGFSDSTSYLALLSVLSVLAIIGIVVILIVAFTSPRD